MIARGRATTASIIAAVKGAEPRTKATTATSTETPAKRVDSGPALRRVPDGLLDECWISVEETIEVLRKDRLRNGEKSASPRRRYALMLARCRKRQVHKVSIRGKWRVIKFVFTARCGEESLPLEVKIDYRPGKQMQRARRVAVGELLAALEIEQASVDASGDDVVTVSTEQGIWVIAESRGTV